MASNIAPDPGWTSSVAGAALMTSLLGGDLAAVFLAAVELHVAALDPLAGERPEGGQVGGESGGGDHDRQLAGVGDRDQLEGGAHPGVGARRAADGGGGERQLQAALETSGRAPPDRERAVAPAERGVAVRGGLE